MPLWIQKNSGSRNYMFLTIVVVVAVLYFAKEVILPFGLALLLTFLLAPLIQGLQRLRLSRVPAVLIATFLSFSLIGIIGWTASTQLLNLAKNLPQYELNLRAKIQSLRGPVGTGLQKTSETYEKLSEELSKTQPGASGSPKVTQVEIVQPPPNAIQILRGFIGPLLRPLGIAVIVIIFVIFMLLKQEDLRDRLIRVIGPEQINVTTQALDDAASRVSRFLLMQSIINGSQGILVAVGLHLIGLPNAILWGALTAILRFIPYIGPWMAAAMPIALSLAVFDNWTFPAMTILLFVVLELISNNVLEPWLYGTHTGLSPIALIVAAVFWTWLWGSIGLLLSTPLTVCLVVMGKYIPQLEFLSILLGDEPGLEAHAGFYQRLLAMDIEEASNLIEKHLKESNLLEVSDRILIPALGLAEQDRHRGELSEEKERYILENLKELILDIFQKPEDMIQQASPDKLIPISIVCLPARDEADEVVAILFSKFLQAEGMPAFCVSVEALAGEMMDHIEQHRPTLVCISALPPSAVTPARYLCKRLRARFPKIPILVGLWNAQGEIQHSSEKLETAGATKIVISLSEALQQTHQIVQPILQGVRTEVEPGSESKDIS